jgi:predicted transcriptional regulator
MDTFDKVLDLQKDLLQSQLRTIYRYQQQSGQGKKRIKRTSKLDIVADILASANQPLHISEIIRIAQQEYQTEMERDSIVSALVKKVKAGRRFVRVAPNTFALKNLI